jgi:hypothetical protein
MKNHRRYIGISVAEATIYAILLIGIVSVQCLIGEKRFAESFGTDSLKRGLITYIVVIIAVYMTQVMGGLSWLNLKNQEYNQVSSTMVTAAISGLITYLVLTVLI